MHNRRRSFVAVLQSRRWTQSWRIALLAVVLSACAGMPGREALQVNVVDVDSAPGEGLELRMLVKLRVQNPNDGSIDYDGVSLRLDVLGRTFASGVSDARGTIPRFGEALIEVPVTVSMLSLAGYALAMIDGKAPDRLDYKLDGRLNAPGFGSTRFHSEGELKLPTPGAM